MVERTDELLAECEEQPLPQGVTPHKLRHTFCSVLIALGGDPATVMGQLGHTDPKSTLHVYTHAMRRGDEERQALRILVEGAQGLPVERAEDLAEVRALPVRPS